MGLCVLYMLFDGLDGLYDAVSGEKESRTGQPFTSPGLSAIQRELFPDV